MEKYSARRRVPRSVLALASAALLIHSASGETSPYATGGEVTARDLGNCRMRYIHVFTNTDEAVEFASTGKRDLEIRYLVVGAGGSGGSYLSGNMEGGGGGGGGGVCEKDGVSFVSGSTWQVIVGKGSGGSAVAGASSISNGVTDVETALGGGNGASGSSTAATSGAAGGGGKRNATSGAVGTYISSILGVSPEGAPFKGGSNSSSRSGGGGGGAGSAGTGSAAAGVKAPTVRGGEGLVSDITGEELVYGSGGGGGCGKNTTPSFYQGGLGGTRAGDGGYFDLVDWTNVTYAATDAEPNSGGGGGGAAGYGANTRRGKGADGIVVIRYEVCESPCEGGDIVTRTELRPGKYRYLHMFTNVADAAEFVNSSGRDLKLRYLVVGGGGSGSPSKYTGTHNSGGGGGGGGVCEKDGILFPSGSTWQILVGKGASSYEETAGASSISNGTADVETVPGGGNAGVCTGKADDAYIEATSGAAGGGAPRTSANSHSGAEGTYPSSVFGNSYGPFAGGKSTKRQGGGGGGAAEKGGDADTVNDDSVMSGPAKGGEGLASDITGEKLVYGSGGGAGECRFTNNNTLYRYQGGDGGTRAGNGSKYVVADDGEVTYLGPTSPEPNSGGGGAGAGNNAKSRYTGGADGVVIIRYDYKEKSLGTAIYIW